MTDNTTNTVGCFDLEILNKLGMSHKILMSKISLQIDTFTTDKDIYDFINNYILDNNLKKAFPIGISINEIIAHDSYHELNLKQLKKGDFIKIDIGLIEKGNIIDSARTFVYNSPVPKCITDCEHIAKSIEEFISKVIMAEGKISIQKISALTNALITTKNYSALDYLGGHTIEFNKVHGKHYILNKPLKLLPKEAEQYIDPNAEIVEGDMFAIEIYIGEKKSDGVMIKSTHIPVTHYQINQEQMLEKIKKFEEKKIFQEIKNKTDCLVYDYKLHNEYDKQIIKTLINSGYIIKHDPLEFKSDSKDKVKYIQYEDCFIIKNRELINLSK